MYHGKLKLEWSDLNIVKMVYPHGTTEITDRDMVSFKVNGQRLKKYYEGCIDKEDDEVIEFENGVTASMKEKQKENATPKPVEKIPMKKAWSVHGEILSAMKRSANKYSILEVYDETEIIKLQEMRNREKVDELIQQTRIPTENELRGCNKDMVDYYEQKKLAMNKEGSEKELDDVFRDMSRIAESIENDGIIFEFPPYPFNYHTRRMAIEEMLDKFIDEGKREYEEMEIFIKEFRTTNEILLKERSNLLSELTIEVNELSKDMNNVLIPKNEVKGVTTRGKKMTSEATHSKEINETEINKNKPLRFEQDVQEKPHDDGMENKSSSIP
nr:zinc knuckle CX2CX4HX4C [Tanacetum cinerariifolium]